jgi:hypothetical protein
MKLSRQILIPIVALLLGWVVGLYSTENYYDRWILRYQTRNAFSGASDRLVVLKALRDGDSNNAVESLEGQLDNQIVLLEPLLKNSSAEPLTARNVLLMTQLRGYREAYPRQTSRPELDRTVAGVLSATNNQNVTKP